MTAVRHVVAAAVKQGEMVCFVPRPGRHHHVMRAMAAAGIPIPIMGEQGFLTDDGRFVDRKRARAIAETARQLIGKPQHTSELFSEDVW